MSVRDELTRLYLRDGSLTPEAVLDAAQPPDSPLHKHFTWDDTEAANKRRLDEASYLIRKCKIRIETAEERTVHVRAFLHLPAQGETDATYAPTADLLSNPATRDVVFAQALRDVEALERKYKDLVDFSQVLTAALAAASSKRRRKAA